MPIFQKGKQYKEQLDFIKNSISAAKSPENTESKSILSITIGYFFNECLPKNRHTMR